MVSEKLDVLMMNLLNATTLKATHYTWCRQKAAGH